MVVKMPKTIARACALRKRTMSTSRPAENINSSLPSSAKKLTMGLSSPNNPRTYGPRTTPKSSNPTISGSLRRRASGGTPARIAMTMANFARGGSAKTCDLIASSSSIPRPC